MTTLAHARKRHYGRMAGFGRALLLVSVALPLFLAACASGKRSLDTPVDPAQEQITILQKQLLELQKVQNETRRQVETQAVRSGEIEARVSTLEAQRTSSPPATLQKPAAAAASQAVSPKKPAAKQPPKKKKTPRRVEP